MKKYIVAVDFKAECNRGYAYVELKAKNVVEAMNEAETYLGDLAYLVSIMEKTSNKPEVTFVSKKNSGEYVEILTNRHNGWHACDEEHGETPYTHIMYKYKDNSNVESLDSHRN